MPRDVSSCDADSQAISQGSACGQTKSLVAPVSQLEAGSNSSSLGCRPTSLVEGEESCVSPFLPHNADTSEIEGRRSRAN